MCFIRKPNVSQKVKSVIHSRISTFFCIMSFCQLLVHWDSLGVKHQVISQYCSEGLLGVMPRSRLFLRADPFGIKPQTPEYILGRTVRLTNLPHFGRRYQLTNLPMHGRT